MERVLVVSMGSGLAKGGIPCDFWKLSVALARGPLETEVERWKVFP